MVSEKHANFIINYDNANTKDVTDLIKFCQDTVYEKFAVNQSVYMVIYPPLKRVGNQRISSSSTGI